MTVADLPLGARPAEEESEMRAIVKLLGVVTLVVGVLGAVFLIGMRRKSPPIQNAVKQASKASKDRVLRTAGAPGSPTAVVRHVGRTTGRSYETPIDAVVVDDGFVVALPYGATTDWTRNVLASGSAVLVVDGGTHDVHEPEVVPMDELDEAFSPRDQRMHRLFKVEHGLRVRRVGTIPG